MYVIEELIGDEKKFFKAFDDCNDMLIEGFELEEVRHKPIEFKFYEDDEEIHSLRVTNFMTNIVMFLPYMRLGLPEEVHLDESYILDFKNLSNEMMASFIDERVTPYYLKKVDIIKYNNVISEWREQLKLSREFTILIGSGMSIMDDVMLSWENEEYDKLLHYRLPSGLQPKEIQEIVKDKGREMFNIILNTEKHPLYPVLRCKEGVKEPQLREYQVSGGVKPDLYGKILPVPLDTNFLVHGLQNVIFYYIDANGGRKAAIMNDEYMGKSGHFSRQLSLLCNDTLLHEDEHYCCDTKHFTKLKIKTATHLSFLRGRYYNKDGKDILIDINDKSLIGQTINLRTPVTCSGDEICYKCYGELAYINKNLNIGSYGSKNISEIMQQNVLSAKHHLTSNTNEIKFNEEFDMYLRMDANFIVLSEDIDSERIADLKLIIYMDDISKEEEYDDKDYNDYLYRFSIFDKKYNTEFDIIEENKQSLYITPALKHLLKRKSRKRDGKYILDLKHIIYDTYSSGDDDDFSDGFPLFNVIISNNELTKPLKDLTELLDRKKRLGCETIDEMVQTALDLMIEGQIRRQLVHMELIIRNLLRDADDVLKRPDFTNKDLRYQILTVTTSLLKNPSLYVTLSFQDLRRQLENPLTYRKVQSSLVDLCYAVNPVV